MKKVKATILIIVILILSAGIKTAQGVDNLGLFELEGNAVQDNAAPPDDWETLYNGGGSYDVFTGIREDANSQTIFVGGRKDTQDVTEWGWKNSGGLPDKDNLTNAYAAAYIDDSDLIIYFGTDRFANKGDAYLAFWFFQDEVSLNPENGKFNGHHVPGDILVLINYPQGTGSSPKIDIVEWNPSEADVADNLKLIASGVECTGGGGPACATTNIGDEVSPWPYQPKSGTSGTFPYESFYEGGINLTEILGTTQCFSSFMAESRSSESFTATLKDFVLSGFPVCKISVSKACQVVRLTDENDPTDKYFVVSFSGDVNNTGVGAFPAGSIVTITDDAGTPGDNSDDVVIKQVLSSPLEPGESVHFSGEFFSDFNPPYNMVRATIAFSNAIVAAEPYGIECTSIPLNPSLSLTKDCNVMLEPVNSMLAVMVNFYGWVCNDGDVPLTVTVTDNAIVEPVFGPTLMAPGDCNLIIGSYLPSHANGDVNNPCEAVFSDTFTATGTCAIPGVEEQTETITANCPLCDCD